MEKFNTIFWIVFFVVFFLLGFVAKVDHKGNALLPSILIGASVVVAAYLVRFI